MEDIAVTETIETSKEELTTGSIFANKYQIIEELGRGGMGLVYKALDTEVNEKVAIKLIKPEIAADKKTIERFRNELKFARKIRHKNVCQMFDLNKEQGSYYITMEYVPGEDLKSLIKKMRLLSPGQGISLAKQICEGLSEAHKLGVVHRDLKPQNIMIDTEGNARIMDFGIARSIEGKSITGAGVIIGTPDYMSPEQIDGKETDQQSDIYSLGVILYEMVTGRVPYEGDTALSIAVKHKTEIPRSPQESNAQIPEALSRLILRCLEKPKENRYQSTEELKEDLGRIEKGLPTTERIVPSEKPLTSKEITVKFTYKKLLIPAIVVIALIAAGLFFLLRKSEHRLDPKRVVVALFENKTGDSNLDNLGYMASNRITQGLSQTDIVSTSTLQDPWSIQEAAKERGGDLVKLLAKETQAGKVVTGSYYLQGETLQFQAQIQEGKTGKIIAPIEPVSGPVDDPVNLSESLRERVMGALATILDERIKSFIGSDQAPYIPTYEAYKEYIEGIKDFTNYEYEKSIEHLKRSISLDPEYILPLSMLHTAYHNDGKLAEAEAVSHKISGFLDKLSAEERTWWEYIDMWTKGNLEAQYQLARKLFEMNPHTGSEYNLGLCANRINRPEESARVLKQVDPESPIMWFSYWSVYANAYFMLGQYKNALKVARESRKYNPDLMSALWLEMRAYIALGKIDKVNELLEESRKLPPQLGWSAGRLMYNAGYFLRFYGHRQEAAEMLDGAIKYFKNLPEKEAEARTNRFYLADSLYERKQWEEATLLYKALWEEDSENDIKSLGRIGLIAIRLGNMEESERTSVTLKTLPWSYPRGYHTFYRARIAAVMGEKEEAVRLLREAFSQGYPFSNLYNVIDFELLKDYLPYVEFMNPKG
jgi:serine/threonine protein kinase/tetratricopeptide (TPR) repeat protein